MQAQGNTAHISQQNSPQTEASVATKRETLEQIKRLSYFTNYQFVRRDTYL